MRKFTDEFTPVAAEGVSGNTPPGIDPNGPAQLSEDEILRMVNVLLSESETVLSRRRAAWTLTNKPTDEVMIYLKAILLDENSPAQLRATILEGMGRSSHPEAQGLLLSAVGDEDRIIVRGAIRGLARIGDEQSVEILTSIMLSKDAPIIISEAANGLGDIEQTIAYEALAGAYRDEGDARGADFQTTVIEAMGKRRITETQELFQKILSDESPEIRLAVVEAVEDAQGDATDILKSSLRDEQSEVRAAAAWTLAVRGDRDDLAADIATVLAAEVDPQVRMRLYQALENQKDPDVSAIAPVVLAEEDVEARLAGFGLMAGITKGSEDPDVKQLFDSTAVPDLEEIAMGQGRLGERLAAVIALRKAETAASARALEDIFVNSADVRVATATGISVEQPLKQ